MKICYDLFENLGGYAVALLAFSLIVQIILFPFGIKQQKSSQKQAKLRPKEAAIRKKYAGRTDRETQMKMNEEIQKLYQEEHFSPLSGCLPLLIQFPILIGLFYVIQRPLSYVSGMDAAFIEELRVALEEIVPGFAGKITDIKQLEIPIIREIFANESAILAQFPNLFNDYVIPNFSMFGGFIDLSMEPFAAFDSISQNWSLLIIPVITYLSAFYGQKLTRKFTYQTQQAQETESSMKLMNIMMPLFSAYLAFRWPAVMGLYWTYRSILSFVQQFLLSRMFPIPVMTEKELKEAEKAYAAQNKAKPYKASENAGRKSLIFDDDEDESAALPATENKSIISDNDEEEPNGESIIPKAPLK